MEIQDNVSKAREIVNSIVHQDNQPIYFMAIREAAEEMAEWKDQQYVEIIKDECNNSYESGLCEGRRVAEKKLKEYLEKKKESMLKKWGILVAAEVSTIDMIINELFKEEK